MIEIREVKTRKEQKEFINFHINLYKGNKAWCPPLYMDEKKVFSKNYPYLDTSDAKYWNAYRDGKMVGRIQAIYQKAANAKWNQKRVRFTRFDSIDDQEVADALFKVVEEYAKSLGMEEVVGPLGFNDLEREGLLIEGFDQLNTFETQYNAPYYQKLIENCGYKKDVDWLEHRLFPHDEDLDKVINIGKKIEAKGNIHLVPKMSFKKFVKKYKDQFFSLYDSGYEGLYGSVPFTDGMKNVVIKNFAPAINMNYLLAAVDNNNQMVALGFCIPNVTEILQKSNGHLYPITALKFLHEVHHPKRIDLGFVTTIPGTNLAGGVAFIYGKMCEQAKKDKLEFVETNLNLEDNLAIIKTWDHFDHITHKKRRSYIKKI